jgi:transposase
VERAETKSENVARFLPVVRQRAVRDARIRLKRHVGALYLKVIKNKGNMTDNQVVKLKDLLRHKLRSVKGYLLREDFQRFWQFRYIGCAEKFLDAWIKRTMYSKLEPMKKMAGTLRNHKDLILNWFHAEGKVSNVQQAPHTLLPEQFLPEIFDGP